VEDSFQKKNGRQKKDGTISQLSDAELAFDCVHAWSTQKNISNPLTRKTSLEF